MPVVAVVDIPSRAFVLGEVLQEVGEYHTELTQFVPTSDKLVPFLWIEHEDDERLESILRNHPLIEEVIRYDERAGRTLYELEWADTGDAFLSAFMERDILVADATGTPERWEFELLASTHGELAVFQTVCTENEIPIEVRRVANPESDDGRAYVTGKQYEMLRLAYDRGYFEVPREVTVTELAEERGVSPQAASKLLRRGLDAVVGHVVDAPSGADELDSP